MQVCSKSRTKLNLIGKCCSELRKGETAVCANVRIASAQVWYKDRAANAESYDQDLNSPKIKSKYSKIKNKAAQTNF